ncbi:MAG TPA: hypothetical protein VHY75_13785 [Steroidobacteraceae bacterium]|nr:hypothetical protein [Steroidobacteraceae bacterium]
MIYNELTRTCFENADCAGTASGPDWFRGEAGGRSRGTWVQFDVQVKLEEGNADEGNSDEGRSKEGGTIRSVRFLAFGCPHVIAAAQWLAERAVGLPARAQLPESVQSLRRRFEVPIEKLGRLLVVEDAWVAALRGATRAD